MRRTEQGRRRGKEHGIYRQTFERRGRSFFVVLMVTGAPADRRTVGDLVQEPVSWNKGWKAPWTDASLASARFSLSLTLHPGLSPCLYTPCQDLINSSSALREERRSKSDRRDGGRVEKEETGGKRRGRRNGGGWEGGEVESVSCETVMDNRMQSGCLWTAKQKWSPPPSHGKSLIAVSLSLSLSHLCCCLLVKSFVQKV